MIRRMGWLSAYTRHSATDDPRTTARHAAGVRHLFSGLSGPPDE
jgi:hypothetical protein